MTSADALKSLGVTAIRRVSDHTTTVEFADGTRPATDLEQKLWALVRDLLANQ